LLKATKNGEDRRVEKYSEYIYGMPDKDVFFSDLKIVREVIEKRKGNDDERIMFAIKRLEDELNFTKNHTTTIDSSFLSQKKEISELLFIKEKTLDAQQIQREFFLALENMGIEGWKVFIDKNIAAITVSQEKKHVSIPEKRKLSETGLRKLIAHEIETHVIRRERGERSKLKLLGLGLDRYLSGEEGIAKMKEQIIEFSDDFPALESHLAISLAKGMDGKKRDFREVCNILRDYFFLKSPNKDVEKAWENAKNNAWSICVRTFRGTTCQKKGACLTRDIIYREGNINAWIVVASKPEEIIKFSLGKYDPANNRHVYLLQQLGISDDDLEALDK
jgi:hypothetical protein